MRLNMRILILACVMCAFSASAQMSQHILQSRAFSDLYISGSVNVECRQSLDSVGMIVFSATPQVYSKIKCYNEGDRLNISLDRTGTLDLSKNLSKIIVYYSGALSTISYTGSGRVVVANPPVGRNVAVLLTGSGNLKVGAIKAQHLSCSVAGSGNLSISGNTIVDNITSTVSGSGAVEIAHANATKTSATVKGPGDFIINGRSNEASFAIKGSGNIDASTLDCTKMTAGIYGSGRVYCSNRVTNLISSGRKENIIIR